MKTCLMKINQKYCFMFSIGLYPVLMTAFSQKLEIHLRPDFLRN